MSTVIASSTPSALEAPSDSSDQQGRTASVHRASRHRGHGLHWARAALCAAGVLIAAASMSGCDSMTPRQQHTAIGAAAGGVGGGLLTGGSALGVVGGAAVGGVIGNSVR